MEEINEGDGKGDGKGKVKCGNSRREEAWDTKW